MMQTSPTGLTSALTDAGQVEPSGSLGARGAQLRASRAAAQRKADLDDIRAKGLVKWSQEQKLRVLREKVLREILKERGIENVDISKLPAAERKSLEEEIAQRIREKVLEATKGEMKDATAQGRSPKPMIIDFSV